VYSNEAGQGTGPHAAAAAEVQHPAQQGLVQAFSVYVDTLFVCSATAFMILITGAYNVHGGENFIVQNLPALTDPESPAFTMTKLSSMLSTSAVITSPMRISLRVRLSSNSAAKDSPAPWDGCGLDAAGETLAM
jgi:Na+/alanine symporter